MNEDEKKIINNLFLKSKSCIFAPAKAPWSRSKTSWVFEYSYSILMVQRSKMSDQHCNEPRNVSTSMLHRRTTSFHFITRV